MVHISDEEYLSFLYCFVITKEDFRSKMLDILFSKKQQAVLENESSAAHFVTHF